VPKNTATANQADARIDDRRAREEMKTREQTQDQAWRNDKEKKSADVFVAPKRLRIKARILSGPETQVISMAE
jgi:hypothetical protein